jgi:hypothetical protein
MITQWMIDDERLTEIEKHLRYLKTVPRQTGLTTYDTARLEMERTVLESKQTAEVAFRAGVLMKLCKDFGSMKVYSPRGGTFEGRPHRSGDPVADVWNIQAEAVRLAKISMGV